MPSYNKVLLMGNITRDVELKYTPGNMAVATIGIAVNRRFKTKEGETKDEVTYVDCEAWGRTAEVIQQYLGKRKPIFIEGRLKLDQWQDKEGGNRSKLKVVVENFQFVDSKGGGGGAGGSGEYVETPQRRAAAPAAAGAAKSQPNNYTGPTHEPLGEDDIPF